MWSWLIERVEALGEHIARYGWSDPLGMDIAPYDPPCDGVGADLTAPEIPVRPQDDLLGDTRQVHA